MPPPDTAPWPEVPLPRCPLTVPPRCQWCAYCMEALAEVAVIGVGMPYAGRNLCLACYATVMEEDA
jgi:hypothetical protein